MIRMVGQFASEERELAPAVPLESIPALNPLVDKAERRWPDAELARIKVPWDEGVSITIRVLHRDAPVWQKFSTLEFDPVSSELKAVWEAKEQPWSAQLSSVLAPLHFGFFGAAWVKWAYFFGGLAPAILSITGVVIWWVRKRAPKRRARQASV